MKRYKPDGDIVVLTRLSKYFIMDPRDLTHIQKTEMLYIYKRLATWLDNADVEAVVGEINRIRILLKIRGRHRSLYYVFYYCQARQLQQSGKYDTETWAPPQETRLF